MHKTLFICFFLSVLSFNTFSQLNETTINELKAKLRTATNDSTRLQFMSELAEGYRFSNVDSSFFYNDIALKLATDHNLLAKKGYLLSLKGATLLESGKLPESLQFQFEALNLSEKVKDSITIAFALNRIGNTYMELGDYPKANAYCFRSKNLFYAINEMGKYYNEVSNIGNIYELMQMPDSALYYGEMVFNASLKTNDRNDFTRPEIMFRMGNAYKAKGNNRKALDYYKRGVAEAYIDNDWRDLSMNDLLIANLYKEMQQPDSSMKYALHCLQTANSISFRKCIYESSSLISELFKNKNEYDSAYKYLIIAIGEKDSLTGTKRFQELQRIVLDEQEQERAVESQRIADRNKEREYVLLAGLAIVLIISILLYRNNKHKQKANAVLQAQKKKIESTLQELKSTQSQLIQSEKMASLGELTAGIAHEIQNPLNFVNNFSDINTELLAELKNEILADNKTDAITIVDDVIANEQKIMQHGKRADSIVKGMLQHSRTSTGQKEAIDINNLADEYLRLSYHGFRAKDKSFNATLHTDFDKNTGKINIVPQEIGRVLLNLFNNAFYAVHEKKKQSKESYEPAVSVSTKKLADKVEIRVHDNGMGISKSSVDKIFQPFFTTKPTGQGTGLGLSLSYDIVKAHGGEISVETKKEGATFIIVLQT